MTIRTEAGTVNSQAIAAVKMLTIFHYSSISFGVAFVRRNVSKMEIDRFDAMIFLFHICSVFQFSQLQSPRQIICFPRQVDAFTELETMCMVVQAFLVICYLCTVYQLRRWWWHLFMDSVDFNHTKHSVLRAGSCMAANHHRRRVHINQVEVTASIHRFTAATAWRAFLNLLRFCVSRFFAYRNVRQLFIKYEMNAVSVWLQLRHDSPCECGDGEAIIICDVLHTDRPFDRSSRLGIVCMYGYIDRCSLVLSSSQSIGGFSEFESIGSTGGMCVVSVCQDLQCDLAISQFETMFQIICV